MHYLRVVSAKLETFSVVVACGRSRKSEKVLISLDKSAIVLLKCVENVLSLGETFPNEYQQMIQKT